MPSIYETWLSNLDKSFVDELSKGKFELSAFITGIKYVGFRADELVQKMQGIQINELMKLLIVFHLRGTQLSKIKQSVGKDFSAMISKMESSYDIEASTTTDKGALTLRRISILAPGISFMTALMLEKVPMFSRFSDKYAVFGINAIPALIAFDIPNRELIWKIYLCLNVLMGGLIPKSKAKTPNVRLEDAKKYAKISLENIRELHREELG